MELSEAELLALREQMREWQRFKTMFPKNARVDLEDGHVHPSTAASTDFAGLEDNAGTAITPDTDNRIQVTDDGKVNADASGNTLALSVAEDQIIHGNLSGSTTTDDHHTRYTDAEARTAVPYLATITFGWDPQSPQVFAP
jgi:hypothetical protein